MFKAFIFDMDGTIVDSALDYQGIRDAIGIPSNIPILEFVQKMPQDKQEQAYLVIDRFEKQGAKTATPMRDFQLFYDWLERMKFPRSIVTRNTKQNALITMLNHRYHFDYIFGRNCFTPKPDPSAVLQIIKNSHFDAHEVAFIGDDIYDIQTAKNAGIKSILLEHNYNYDFRSQADFVINSFEDLKKLVS